MSIEQGPTAQQRRIPAYGLDEWERKKGSGDNRLRTGWAAQPRALQVGDVLATGDEILAEPAEAGSGRVTITLAGGRDGHKIEVPSRIPIALAEGEVRKFRPKFEGLQNETERIVYDILRRGLRIFLFGVHDSNPKLREESRDALRVGGQLLANAFELTDDTVIGIADSLEEDAVDLGSGMPGIGSFIKARLAEGIYEAGQEKVAKSVAETLTAYPDTQAAVLGYFACKDTASIRPHHV
jgi:hypothetical protein